MDDRELITRAMQGDPEARSTVFNRGADLVFRILWRYAGGEKAVAEDLTQNVMLQIFQKLDAFGPPYNLAAWMARIAHNAGIDYVRERRREKDTLAEYTYTLGPRPPNPEEECFRKQCRELFATALTAEGDPSCRETARLFYEQDLSVNEISDHQALSVTAVTTRLSRFRARLRKLALKKALV